MNALYREAAAEIKLLNKLPNPQPNEEEKYKFVISAAF